MFSFGLFSTHLPFIVIGIVSFASMAYAYLNPGALVEKENQNTLSLDFEVHENIINSAINFYEADVQFHAVINKKPGKLTPLYGLISIISPKPDKPPLGEYHFYTFFARPPPSL